MSEPHACTSVRAPCRAGSPGRWRPSLLLAGAGDLDAAAAPVAAMSAPADAPAARRAHRARLQGELRGDGRSRRQAGRGRLRAWSPSTSPRTCACSTRARSRRRPTPPRASGSAGSGVSTPDAHLVLTGCSVDANPGAYTTVDSIFANRDKDEHRGARARDVAHGATALRRRPARCARARSSRCRTAATTAARTASCGGRAATSSSVPAARRAGARPRRDRRRSR